MGGIAISGPKRAAARRIIEILFSHIRVEKRMLKNYGCMTAEYNKYVSGMVDKDIKAAAYRQQARNAKTRGIAFNLTFPAWDKIWEASGHYANRGTKSGQYVMSRYGDKGPYAIGNVEVKTASENHSENRYK